MLEVVTRNMQVPLYSTITLFAEIVISTIIFYTFYRSYKYNKFPTKLAAFALLYEIVFNISYMASRVPNHTEKIEIPWHVALAIFHGTLSLLMFISLIIFFVLAWRRYKKGTNYFKVHKNFTIIFLIFWSASVLSGIIFYFIEYFT